MFHGSYFENHGTIQSAKHDFNEELYFEKTFQTHFIEIHIKEMN